MKEPPTLYFNDGLSFEEALSPEVLEIWKRPQYTQRTEEWYAARDTCISASDIATALTMDDDACDYYIEHFNLTDFKKNPKKSCNHYAKPNELLLKKCNLGPPFKGNEHTYWGQKFEQIVTTVYSQLKQKDVLEFGLIFHPTVPFLAASPDGITTDGVMLEIKCPTSRPVGPVPPLHYFQQMLMQLECCGLDRCDFFDAHFVEYLNEEDWLADAEKWVAENPEAKHHEFGIILCSEHEDPESEVPHHTYAPPNVVTPQDFLRWKEKVESDQHDTEFTPTYYKLNKYFITSVKASPEWFKRNYPVMDAMWKKIEYYRTPEGLQILKDSIAKKNTTESDSTDGISIDVDVSLTKRKTTRKFVYKHAECLLDTFVDS